MNADMHDLYQEVVIDHSRSPRNCRRLPHANRHAQGYNPLCGDRLDIYVVLNGDTIEDVGFEVAGCAISTASASLMSEALKGRTVAQAEALGDDFRAMVTGGTADPAGAPLGKLEALAGVREFPARIKCATLAWHTLLAALHGEAAASTE